MSRQNDYFPDTLIPRHLSFATVGASSVSTSLTSLVTVNKSFTDFEALGGGPNHTTFRTSGYVYITFIEGQTTLTETFLIFDSDTNQDVETSNIEETLVVLDSEESVAPTNSSLPFYGARDYFIQEVHPTYTNFSAQSAGPAHTDFKSIVGGPKGYVLEPQGGSAAHFGFKLSGWQYLLTDQSNYETELEETFLVFDSETSESPDQTVLFEYLLVGDSEIVQDAVTGELSDYVLLLDGATGEIAPLPVEFDGTLVLTVISAIGPQFSNVLKVQAALEENFSVDLGVTANDLTAVVSASSASNPITPTFINSGVVIYSNPATLPATIPPDGCKVFLPCTNIIGSLGANDLKEWDINLQDAGGTWNVKSFTDLPTYGTEITLFGLTGTITSKGFEWSNSGSNYKNGGIFGPRALNREAFFLTYGQPESAYNIVTKYANYPMPEFYKTHKDAASMVASLGGARLQWMLPDFPLPNFQFQGGETALAAIHSLAGDCGGVIRWMGSNSYRAMFPDIPIGVYTIPDCCLIRSISQECYLDLNSGYYTPGVYVLPQLNIKDTTTLNLTQAGDGTFLDFNPLTQHGPYTGQVENRWSTGRRPSDEMPIQSFDLPLDTNAIFIRIITKTAGSGNFVVTESEMQDGADPWYTLENVPGSNLINGGGSPHTVALNKDGIIKYLFNVTSDLFPAEGVNDDIDNGNFTMQIGITRTIPPYVNNAIGSYLLAAKSILKYRFVPACTGTVVCSFFGSIPMPGMELNFTFNNTLITGIIESVSFSGPDTLTINYVKWFRFEFYQQLAQSENNV